MRKIIRRILQMLDGTPKVQGIQPRGQSLVELALVMPLLIILLVGLVEIGYFARNYMTLLEVTRVGARRGATLQEQYSPITWDRTAASGSLPLSEMSLSPSPNTDLRIGSGVFGSAPVGVETPYEGYLRTMRSYYRDCAAVAAGRVPDLPDEVPPPDEDTDNEDELIIGGFYNIVLCQMLNSMDPLVIDPRNGIDDIVISVFSVLMINNNPLADGGDIDLAADAQIVTTEFDTRDHIPVVVGRYPKNANECNVWQERGTETLYIYSPPTYPDEFIFERDPFDYYQQNNGLDVSVGTLYTDLDGDGAFLGADEQEFYPLELAEEVQDPPGTFYWQSIGYDDYSTKETQRGFVYTGQHRIEGIERDMAKTGTTMDLLCYGSQFSVYDIQAMLMGGGFILSEAQVDQIQLTDPGFCQGPGGTNCDQREYLPSNGVVLVELYWQHTLLLDLPVFSPIYNALNDNQTTISVWSAFPTPSTIPEVRYTVNDNQLLVP